MLQPGRGKDHSRLRNLERAQSLQNNRLIPPDSRPAAPLIPRYGIWRAICTSPITRASAGQVQLVYFNGTAYVSVEGDPKVCRGFMLNTDETIAAEQALWVVHLPDNTWEVFSGNCKVRDWLLSGEEA